VPRRPASVKLAGASAGEDWVECGELGNMIQVNLPACAKTRLELTQAKPVVIDRYGKLGVIRDA
jgi:hypothetical protein